MHHLQIRRILYSGISLSLLSIILASCSAPNKVDENFKRHTLNSGGHTRSYSVYTPLTKTKIETNSQQAPSAVFILHGSRGSGTGMREMVGSEFEALAQEHNLVLVYPDGYENHWNDCRASADYAANTENINDVKFMRAIIENLASDYYIDKNHIHILGLSNGGHMVLKLALETPKLFLGHVSIVANLPVDSNLDCKKSGQAVSIAIFNGTEDPINPNEGGLVSILGNDSRGEVLSTDDTIKYWLELSNASDFIGRKQLPETDGDSETSVMYTHWRGTKNEQIELYSLQGSGHTFPMQHPAKSILGWLAGFMIGKPAADIDGPGIMIEYFKGLEASLKTTPQSDHPKQEVNPPKTT